MTVLNSLPWLSTSKLMRAGRNNLDYENLIHSQISKPAHINLIPQVFVGSSSPTKDPLGFIILIDIFKQYLYQWLEVIWCNSSKSTMANRSKPCRVTHFLTAGEVRQRLAVPDSHNECPSVNFMVPDNIHDYHHTITPPLPSVNYSIGNAK